MRLFFIIISFFSFFFRSPTNVSCLLAYGDDDSDGYDQQ